MTEITENGKNVIRKVSIRFDSAEVDPHQEGRSYLTPNTEACGVLEPPHYITSQEAPESLSSSLFSVYTCQDTGQDPEVQKSDPDSTPAALHHSEADTKREELVRDVTGRDKSLVDDLDQSVRKTTDATEGQCFTEGAQQCRRNSAGPRLPTSLPRSTERWKLFIIP